MPKLTMTFMNLALVVHSPNTSRLLTVATDHRAELSTDAGFNRVMTGETVTVGVRNQPDLTGKSLRPTGTRLVHFDWIVNEPVQLRSDATIAALVNADVRLPAGRWIEADPEIRIAELEVFREEEWEFKDALSVVRHTQKLTNVVSHVSDLTPGETYQLRIGGAVVEEFPGDTDKSLIIENYETGVAPAWARVIDDFALFFPLLETPASGFVAVHQTSAVNPPAASFTRPICPNAQIG